MTTRSQLRVSAAFGPVEPRPRKAQRVFASALLGAMALAALTPTGARAAATDTWQGGGANTNWSTAANWVGGVAPASGDALIFPASANLTSVNDLSGASFTGVTFSGSGYNISGNTFSVAGPIGVDATVTSGTDWIRQSITFLTGGGSISVAHDSVVLWLDGPVSGVPTLDKLGNGTLLIRLLGDVPQALQVDGGVLTGVVSGSSASTITVSPGATFDMAGASNHHNLVLSGTGYVGHGALTGCYGGSLAANLGTITLAADSLLSNNLDGCVLFGDINLGAHILTIDHVKTQVMGNVTGSGGITLACSGCPVGIFELVELASTTAFTGVATVPTGGALDVEGSVQNVVVSGTGTVIGGGSIANLTTVGSAVLWPTSLSFPPSPATLTVGSALSLGPGRTYRADLGVGSPTQNDRLSVTSGSVAIGGATLAINLTYNGLPVAPTQRGADYSIITAAGGVTGTFANVPNHGVLTGNDGNQYAVTYTPTSVIVTRISIDGLVLDGYGGLHYIGGAGINTTGAPYWGWRIARGVAVIGGGSGGYTLDGWGGVHGFGSAPPVAGGAYWQGWDIARAIALNPCDATGHSGYVLDGFGGIHPFGGAPSVTSHAYWNGWDIARAMALNPCNGGTVSGYVLDGLGGLHGFSSGTAVADPSDNAYWPGWNIARAVVVTGAGRGYTLDGYGGLHPFGGSPAMSPAPAYFGWDIARGVVMLADGSGGYVLDGYGGVHPFGLAGPVATQSGAYWPGWDIAHGMAAT